MRRSAARFQERRVVEAITRAPTSLGELLIKLVHHRFTRYFRESQHAELERLGRPELLQPA